MILLVSKELNLLLIIRRVIFVSKCNYILSGLIEGLWLRENKLRLF